MGTFTFPFRLPNELMEEFGAFTGVHWCGWEIEPFICDAIRAYMKPQPAAQPQQAAVADAGYQWKQVFLPEGTRLRASFGRTPYFAVVQGNEIRCGEQSLSPSAFANLQGSGNRNAWKAVWLRFPGNEQWVLAAACRAQQKAVIARLFGAAETQQDAAPGRALPMAPAAPAAPPSPATQSGRKGARASGKAGKRRGGGKGRKHGKRHKQHGQHTAARRAAS
ncbi:hypothetical protein [Duganella sp.]|uniref:hypothetical protein n=1 Tax=Duganella sp. TaxID=1904440 RepID=UPI0031D84438